jgi:hypothetical protein
MICLCAATAARGCTAPLSLPASCAWASRTGSHTRISCGDLRDACCMYVRTYGGLLTVVEAPEGRSKGTCYMAGLVCVRVCLLVCLTSCPLSTKNSTATTTSTAPRILHSPWLSPCTSAVWPAGETAALQRCGRLLKVSGLLLVCAEHARVWCSAPRKKDRRVRDTCRHTHLHHTRPDQG